jgi:hypothetical protein
MVTGDRLRLHMFQASSCCQVEPDRCAVLRISLLEVSNRPKLTWGTGYVNEEVHLVQFFSPVLMAVDKSAIDFLFKYATPPDTTHFRRFIWTRSLRLTKIETDVCIHTPYRI